MCFFSIFPVTALRGGVHLNRTERGSLIWEALTAGHSQCTQLLPNEYENFFETLRWELSDKQAEA